MGFGGSGLIKEKKIQQHLKISVHLKSGVIRRVSFGGSGLIKGRGLLYNPLSGYTLRV
jgi:hypothetical protein